MTLPAAVEAIRRRHRDDPTVAALCVEVERLNVEVEDLRRSRMAWALEAERGQVLSLIDTMLDSHRGHRDAARSDEESMYAHGAINALHLLRERIEARS